MTSISKNLKMSEFQGGAGFPELNGRIGHADASPRQVRRVRIPTTEIAILLLELEFKSPGSWNTEERKLLCIQNVYYI